MIKMNFSKLLATLYLGVSLYNLQVHADNMDSFYNVNYYTPNVCNSSFGVDFLYWKPCVDDLDYAALVSDTENFEVEYNRICPDWKAGVRVFGEIPAFCRRFDFYASYTYLKFDDKSTTRSGIGNEVTTIDGNPFNFTGNNLFDRTKCRYEGRYQSFDVLFKNCLMDTAYQKITSYFGITGVAFDQKLGTDSKRLSPNAIFTTSWKSDYFGMGLKLGTEWRYDLCDGLFLFADTSGAVLTGSSDNKSLQNLETKLEGGVLSMTKFCYEDASCSQILPGYHIQTGFNYETFSFGCEFAIRIGYEFLTWHNFSNERRFFSSQDAVINESEAEAPLFIGNPALSIQTNTRTLGFHGFFAGLDLKF